MMYKKVDRDTREGFNGGETDDGGGFVTK